MKPCPKVNVAELKEEVGSLWRRRSGRWGQRR
jgi:hypothetical protein